MFPKSALTVVYNILIVGRVFLTPIFYEDPPYIAYPRFQILSNTLPRPPSSTPIVFFVFLFLWLNGWSRHIWRVILLNDNTDLQMSTLGTLVQEGPCCVFYATWCQVYWCLTQNFLLVLWFDITQTQKQGAHSGHTHVFMYVCMYVCM